MSNDDEHAPPEPVRWFRPFVSSSYLELLPTPVLVGASDGDKWVALTESESDKCEALWEEEGEDGTMNELSEEGEEEWLFDESHVGVPIGKEKLFEVDVRRMRLVPIYWRSNTPPLKVRRVIWLYDETHPVDDGLSKHLEAAYDLIQPWRSTYIHELNAALSLGPQGYAKLLHSFVLDSQPNTQMHILFEDEFCARIISGNLTARISSTLLSPFRKTMSIHPLPAGMFVYRGYNKACERTGTASMPPVQSGIVTTEDPDGIVRPVLARTKSVGMGDERMKEVTDLILVIHGIGQGLAASWEAFNFLYATNLLRQVSEKQSTHPAISSVMRSRRIQFLPVLWRANLKLTSDEEREREEEGLLNRFTLEDITLNNKIPFVRDVMNNVLIDVPYFMSHHREKMIESVCSQANQIYKLWCARNPGFDKSGRVHIIAHSLGSALAAHILSNQPTVISPTLKVNEQRSFLFNTSCLFMLGSPLGVFLHINQGQLIARKGRERTQDAPADEALAREGVFGCLAVDSIYNIFNSSDPIAYRLNPCVDSEHGRTLLPSSIPSLTGTMVATLSSRVSRWFGSITPVSLSSSPNVNGNIQSRSSSQSRGLDNRELGGLELGGANERLEGTRAQRRFRALNRHGTLDFDLRSDGTISEYLDMLTAHSSYWADPNFASFVLSEICARREDLLRTNLGPTAY